MDETEVRDPEPQPFEAFKSRMENPVNMPKAELNEKLKVHNE